MASQLAALPGLTVYPSQGNFLFVRLPVGAEGTVVRDRLLAEHRHPGPRVRQQDRLVQPLPAARGAPPGGRASPGVRPGTGALRDQEGSRRARAELTGPATARVRRPWTGWSADQRGRHAGPRRSGHRHGGGGMGAGAACRCRSAAPMAVASSGAHGRRQLPWRSVASIGLGCFHGNGSLHGRRGCRCRPRCRRQAPMPAPAPARCPAPTPPPAPAPFAPPQGRLRRECRPVGASPPRRCGG